MSDESGYTAAAGEGVFSPGNDLTTRLRAGECESLDEADPLMREAADRIEALEARIVTLQGEQVAGIHFMQERDAALAGIAEALEILTREGIWLNRDHLAIEALSRVPQGAADV